MKLAVLFSGQGAQRVGMGSDLAAASPAAGAWLRRAERALGRPLLQIMREGPAEELTRTYWCQPALYAQGMALLEALRERAGETLRIQAAAGLSLGEFTAHAAAGSFSAETGLHLVARRGEFMEEAAAAADGTMAALIGGSVEAARALAAAHDVDVANLNCPGQTVISGARRGVRAAAQAAREAGFKLAKVLQVGGAYHSRLMQPAQTRLAAELAAAEIAAPQIPVWSNALGSPAGGPAAIRSSLERQVTETVRWTECVQGMLAAGCDLFLELGPGKVLTGLMGRICKEAECIPVEDAAGVAAAAERLGAG